MTELVMAQTVEVSLLMQAIRATMMEMQWARLLVCLAASLAQAVAASRSKRLMTKRSLNAWCAIVLWLLTRSM